jgi:hypothetical protein
MADEEHRITVGDLREQLSGYSDDTEITFGGTLDAVPLIFYRVKTRGDKLVQIELNELRDEEGTEGEETIEDKVRAIVLEELYESLVEAEPDMEYEGRKRPLIAGGQALHVLRTVVDRRFRELHPAAYDRAGRRMVPEHEMEDEYEEGAQGPEGTEETE